MGEDLNAVALDVESGDDVGAGLSASPRLLGVPHTVDPKPSWYGKSVGHYENGDTLVVDTIGLSDRTYVDNYRTPHTTKLHVGSASGYWKTASLG
jgi:hypothetical protein